ncbi:hypothetical protein BH11BAC4_BH11BAC4_00210 [soil metagenome]
MHSNLTIQNELKELNSLLASISNRNVYTVPDGYFQAMVTDIINTIGREPGMGSENPALPDGYFEHLADSIMGKIKAATVTEEESSLLMPLRTIPTYTIPQGYFEDFAGSVMNKIDSIAEESAELLDAVKHINPYTVPQGYFDGLATDIVSKVPQQAKVFVLQQRSSFFRYAVAAVITGILGLSVISIVDNKQEDAVVVSPVTANVMETATQIIADHSFDTELAKLSDADIVSYLQSNGEDVNTALVASAAYGKALPEEVDYLTDDKTLDNFLNELNIKKDNQSTN